MADPGMKPSSEILEINSTMTPDEMAANLRENLRTVLGQSYFLTGHIRARAIELADRGAHSPEEMLRNAILVGEQIENAVARAGHVLLAFDGNSPQKL